VTTLGPVGVMSPPNKNHHTKHRRIHVGGVATLTIQNIDGLMSGVDVAIYKQAKDESGRTPLIWAADRGD
jgi:hypothetical protein